MKAEIAISCHLNFKRHKNNNIKWIGGLKSSNLTT
jgi:hypothetical protein